MLKVWIAGANGQIGRALNDVLDPMQIETLNTDLDAVSYTHLDVYKRQRLYRIKNIIIHTEEKPRIRGMCVGAFLFFTLWS